MGVLLVGLLGDYHGGYWGPIRRTIRCSIGGLLGRHIVGPIGGPIGGAASYSMLNTRNPLSCSTFTTACSSVTHFLCYFASPQHHSGAPFPSGLL